MDACPLRLFTWVVLKGGRGKSVVAPVCLQHPDAPVKVDVGQGHVAATCSVGDSHTLNVCLKSEFDGEREEARRRLMPREWWAEYHRKHG